MFCKTSPINIKREKIETLIECVKHGIPIQFACDRAGIPIYFYYKWLKIYNDFIAEHQLDENVYTDIEELEGKEILNKDNQVVGYTYTPISIINNIKIAYASWVLEKHNQVNKGDSNWQSAAWLLERRIKAEYGREEQPTTTTDKVESIKIVYIDPKDSKDRLAQLEQEVKESLNAK